MQRSLEVINNPSIEVKYELLKHGVALPTYATPGSSGMDVYAANNDDIILESYKSVLIPSGFKLALPQGYEAQVRSRSGLAYKNGIVVLNSPGTIDSDYRGEVQVLLFNTSPSSFTITRGMKLAQLVVTAFTQVRVVVVSSLDGETTARNEAGFGSTGV